MFCQSLALGLLGSRVAYALKEPYTLVYGARIHESATFLGKGKHEYCYATRHNLLVSVKSSNTYHNDDFMFCPNSSTHTIVTYTHVK